MIGRWIRIILARSLYKEITSCRDCERADNGFDNWNTCPRHENHVELHNMLTSFKERR